MLTIDGARGEGGGQVLRTALALSMATQTPFKMVDVRAGRAKGGLLRQHLTALRAARDVSGAEIEGDVLGSREITFRPGTVKPGAYTFDVGSAGSATLVLQTILPVLLAAPVPSTVRVRGGTHNPGAPPFPFLADAFAPLVRRMGGDLSFELIAAGFAPAGGGELLARIGPSPRFRALSLTERGAPGTVRVRALLAQLGRTIAEREIRTLLAELAWDASTVDARPDAVPDPRGPGNAVVVTLPYEHVTEVFTGFGMRGVPAEAVAKSVADEVRTYLATEAPVGPHLADQLVTYLALGEGGTFRCNEVTLHLETQFETMRYFLDRRCTVEPDGGASRITVQ